MSELNARILLAEDKDLLLAFERERMVTEVPDSMEREMQSWSARWRAEALDHYLKMGWCFASFKDGKLQGYILGQPLLFFRGLTQTVWVEHLAYNDRAVALQLVDMIHKWARDKHLQCVCVEETETTRFILEEWKQANKAENPLIELKSARYS